MTVISITIVESSEQVVSGIPRIVSVSTNISATIFYTLDGNDPTLFSSIYTGPIRIPYDRLSITLKVMATNGTDSSPIVTEIYTTNILNNTRLPHSATTAQASNAIADNYPFGTNPTQPTGQFLNPGDAGVTVDDPSLAQISNGFDGTGIPNNFTNQPFNSQNYEVVYSTKDAEGRENKNTNNLPGTVTIPSTPKIPESSDQLSNLFDPRAMVIFQDLSKENPDDPPHINRQFFSLEDSEKAKDGSYFFASGLDSPSPTGSFLRAHYNPRTNENTYYYIDTLTNKWIISKAPFHPTGTFDGNMGSMPKGRNSGVGIVLEWLPFTRRVLF